MYFLAKVQQLVFFWEKLSKFKPTSYIFMFSACFECLRSWYNLTKLWSSWFSFLSGKNAWSIWSTKAIYSSLCLKQKLEHWPPTKRPTNLKFYTNSIILGFLRWTINNNFFEENFYPVLEMLGNATRTELQFSKRHLIW